MVNFYSAADVLLKKANFLTYCKESYQEYILLFKLRYGENWRKEAIEFYEYHLNIVRNNSFINEELYELAVAYEEGLFSLFGIELNINLQKAAELYELAYENNFTYTEPVHKLVKLYQGDLRSEENLKKAFKLLEQVVISIEEPKSFNALGECYFEGLGVEKDYSKTFEYCYQAATKDHEEAQYNIGFCYENGYGVNPSMESAIKWYIKSAEQGFELAIERLKDLHRNGDIGLEDSNEQKYNTKSALQEMCDIINENLVPHLDNMKEKSLQTQIINSSIKIVPYRDVKYLNIEPIDPDMFGFFPQYLVVTKDFAENNLTPSALKYAIKTVTDYIYVWNQTSYIVKFELPVIFSNYKDTEYIQFGDVLRCLVNYCMPYMVENDLNDNVIYQKYLDNFNRTLL